jgi:hypothetical protein
MLVANEFIDVVGDIMRAIGRPLQKRELAGVHSLVKCPDANAITFMQLSIHGRGKELVHLKLLGLDATLHIGRSVKDKKVTAVQILGPDVLAQDQQHQEQPQAPGRSKSSVGTGLVHLLSVNAGV